MTRAVPIMTFAGGAGTVTGSKTVIDTAAGRLLVDCGLFQGHKRLRLQNWAPFPVPPDSIDAIVLTHAHLDHCGYIPRLHKLGFRGRVYATEGTRRLAEIVLPDSGYLQEEEARYANRKGFSRHDPAEPLYTKEDAAGSLGLFESMAFGEPVNVLPGAEVTWQKAGHILGSATVRLQLAGGTTVVFSGDLGTSQHPLLLPPDPIGPADVVVTESTYGDEFHASEDAEERIAAAIQHIVDTGGVLVVPAFAVDRTEVVLWHLDRLVASGRVPDLPVFVDSPMASRALGVYREQALSGSPEFRSEHHHSPLFSSVNLTETTTVDESKELNWRTGPMIVISASGMATGGRVIHHLAHRLGTSDNAVMLVGFQAPGTRGAALRDGAEKLKMLGHYYQVRARVFDVDLSAHADQNDLIAWLGTAVDAEIVYINHGEPEGSVALERTIEKRLGLHAVVPEQGERVRLDAPQRSLGGWLTRSTKRNGPPSFLPPKTWRGP